MTACVDDICNLMETIAPARLAESWDNVGLQVGDRRWPVKTVWVALDPLAPVVAAACRAGVDLLITHHPLVFKPLKRIDLETQMGAIIQMALTHRLAIFSAHTNLDSANDGLNDLLARRIGLSSIGALSPVDEPPAWKVVLTVPESLQADACKILQQENETSQMAGFHDGAGGPVPEAPRLTLTRIGSLDAGQGSDALSEGWRIEAVVSRRRIDGLLKEFTAALSGRVDWEIIPLAERKSRLGLGRIGLLPAPMTLEALARQVKNRIPVETVRFAGEKDLVVKKVAVCTGSGSSLLEDFAGSGAEAYISGDLRYHDARWAEETGRGLIDLGHFASEHLVVGDLAERLQTVFDRRGLKVKAKAYDGESEPFKLI